MLATAIKFVLRNGFEFAAEFVKNAPEQANKIYIGQDRNYYYAFVNEHSALNVYVPKYNNFVNIGAWDKTIDDIRTIEVSHLIDVLSSHMARNVLGIDRTSFEFKGILSFSDSFPSKEANFISVFGEFSAGLILNTATDILTYGGSKYFEVRSFGTELKMCEIGSHSASWIYVLDSYKELLC